MKTKTLLIFIALTCLPFTVFSSPDSIATEQGKEFLSSIEIYGSTLTRSQYVTYLKKTQFNAILDGSMSLDNEAIRNAGLHCVYDANTVPVIDCPQRTDYTSAMQSFFLDNPVTQNSLLSLPLWNAIFNHRANNLFQGKQTLSRIEIGYRLIAIKERLQKKARMAELDALLAVPNNTPQNAGEQWLWQSVFDKIDSDGSGDVDQFEYLAYFKAKALSERKEEDLLKEFVTLSNKDTDQDIFTISRSFLSAPIDANKQVLANKQGPQVIHSDAAFLFNAQIEFRKGLNNVAFAASAETVKIFASTMIDSIQKQAVLAAQKNDPNASSFSLPYIKGKGIIILGDISVDKDTKRLASNSESVVAGIRVVEDYTDYSEDAKPGKLSWKKTDGKSQTTANIAVKIDWYIPAFRTTAWLPDILSSGIAYNRSGDGEKSARNDEQFLFLIGKYDFIHSNSFLPRSTLSLGPRYTLQQTIAPKTDEDAKLTSKLNKLSLVAQWKPVLQIGKYKLGEPFFDVNGKESSWTITPTFGVELDKLNQFDLAQTAPTPEQALDFENIKAEALSEKEFQYFRSTLSIAYKPSKKWSLVYAFTQWEELGNSEGHFEFQQINANYKFSAYDNVTVSAIYKEGVESTNSKDSEIFELGLGISF